MALAGEVGCRFDASCVATHSPKGGTILFPIQESLISERNHKFFRETALDLWFIKYKVQSAWGAGTSGSGMPRGDTTLAQAFCRPGTQEIVQDR